MTLSPTARSASAQAAAALLFAAALAGCQAPASSGPPPPPPAFAAPNFGSPAFGTNQAASASPMQRSTTLSSSSKSWVTPDGTRHTKSSSTTASVRVDPNAMGNAAAMLFGAMMGQSGTAPAPVTKGQIAGDWNVEVDGRQCRMSLRPTGAGMGDFASTFGCMGTDLQSVSSWSLRGNEVVLSGIMSKRVAVLALNGTNRMDGTADGSSGRIVAWR
ncbi:AprI/Inh family metalloprotease inhibitor [Stappia indica]|uniref:AprI/Inh family metalloprotease inhibitor n=1 Tax=Stappia indica TaxID=538381 RepID=UPI001D1932D9|nr:AprI/Inh family metalloprotease inhibitor [Stappia indica]MCC4242789.1 protease inhibitor Inh/omp19 family protein [Stappia indica]